MSTDSDKLDLVWGVEAIAELIGRSQRQAFHMLQHGQLPGKKIGDRWVVSRQKLVDFFESEAA